MYNRELRITHDGPDPETVERLLRALPDWFGIEESLVEYVAEAARLPAYLAHVEGDREPAGVLLVERHFPDAAEVYLMAVAPTRHRRGIGRALLAAAESDLLSQGVRFLQVKTLGPSRPDEHYGRTRSFYLAQGFTALEEIHGLWAENPCLILVKALASSR